MQDHLGGSDYLDLPAREVRTEGAVVERLVCIRFLEEPAKIGFQFWLQLPCPVERARKGQASTCLAGADAEGGIPLHLLEVPR